jgi:hypothetical protein
MFLQKDQDLRPPFNGRYGMLEQVLLKGKPYSPDNAFLVPLDWNSYIKTIEQEYTEEKTVTYLVNSCCCSGENRDED